MDHHDPSQRPFAPNPYSTPAQPQYSSTQGWAPYGVQQPQSESDESTPRYNTTPRQAFSGSGSAPLNTPLASQASFGSVHILEQQPTGFSTTARAGDAGIYYSQGQTTHFTPAYTPATHSLHYPASSPASALQHAAGSQAGRPRFASTYEMGQGDGRIAQTSQVTYGQPTGLQPRANSAPQVFGMGSNFSQPEAASQYGVQHDPNLPTASQVLSSPLHFPAPNQFVIPSTNQPTQTSFLPQSIQSGPSGYDPYAVSSPWHPELAQGPIDQNQPIPVDPGQRDYELHLATIFQEVHRGMLRGLDRHLLAASKYRLGNIERLRMCNPLLANSDLERTNSLLLTAEAGLHLDHEDPNDERVKPLQEQRASEWNTFNRAWLATLQSQYDLTQEMLQTNHVRSILDAGALTNLADELVRLSDGAERFGLVDYEAGVAEDEIMNLLILCLDLIQEQPTTDISSSQAEPSSASTARSRQQRR